MGSFFFRNTNGSCFYGICRTFSAFSKMTLINVMALVVFEIVRSHFSQASLNDNVIKISRCAQADIAFIFQKH